MPWHRVCGEGEHPWQSGDLCTGHRSLVRARGAAHHTPARVPELGDQLLSIKVLRFIEEFNGVSVATDIKGGAREELRGCGTS
jgi:hypothetical protein